MTIRGHKFAGEAKPKEIKIDEIVQNIVKVAEINENQKLSKSLGLMPSDSSHANIDLAKIVLCGGRGIKAKKDFTMLYDIAKNLPSAAVGASRGAVDDGYAKFEQQIGQSGKCLTSDIYIGIGVSGALQHLAGVVDVKKVIAINTDPEANLIKVF